MALRNRGLLFVEGLPLASMAYLACYTGTISNWQNLHRTTSNSGSAGDIGVSPSRRQSESCHESSESRPRVSRRDCLRDSRFQYLLSVPPSSSGCQSVPRDPGPVRRMNLANLNPRHRDTRAVPTHFKFRPEDAGDTRPGLRHGGNLNLKPSQLAAGRMMTEPVAAGSGEAGAPPRVTVIHAPLRSCSESDPVPSR